MRLREFYKKKKHLGGVSQRDAKYIPKQVGTSVRPSINARGRVLVVVIVFIALSSSSTSNGRPFFVIRFFFIINIVSVEYFIAEKVFNAIIIAINS